jgi:O-antigen/teichoic acid export membrane protein
VNSAAKAIGPSGLKRRALSLGAVKAFDQALQFLLPVVLVRCLDGATFGEYRLLWLAVGTLMALATLNMCSSLYFFVPRAAPGRKRVYIQNTLGYLAVSGLACALALSPWNPLLPETLKPLAPYGWLVPAFVGLWVASFLMDSLPTVDERIRWQAYATLSVASVRAALVGFGAWASGELRVMLWLLLAVVALKLVLLLCYVHRHHGLGRPWFERTAFVEQFRQAAPFGVSNTLFTLRAQADQWVAASLFALSSFAAFSIAAVVGQAVHLVRQSVMGAFMPAMSRMEAAGDPRGMLDLNRRANVIVANALLPLLAGAFVFAGDIVALVYTPAYLEAVPAMRVYVIGLAAMVIEIGGVVLLLRQGRYALRVTAVLLAFSIAASWAAAQTFGLAGAAVGSVAAIYLDRFVMLRRVARLSGIPLRELQHWRSLGWTLLTAVIAGALAWAIAPDGKPVLRLLAGSAVLAAGYLAMNLGTRRR